MTMNQASVQGGFGRTGLFALVTAAAVLVVYWLAGQAGEVPLSVGTGVLIGLIGLAAGAALGAIRLANRWSTWEAVLVTALAVVCGLIFWSWGLTVWQLVRPLKAIPGIGPGLRDLFYGAWFLPAVLVPYIIRRPGTAVVGEMIAVTVQAFIGTEWGLTLFVSGLIPGGLAEIVFAAFGWRRFSWGVLLLAGAAAGLGSFLVDANFLYAQMAWLPKVAMLGGRMISGALLTGVPAKLLADALVRTGVLNNVQIVREARAQGQ